MQIFLLIQNYYILCYISKFQDLSAHTRQTPDQRLATMKKFVDSVNRSEEARQQLANWGLRLDNSALAVRYQFLFL